MDSKSKIDLAAADPARLARFIDVTSEDSQDSNQDQFRLAWIAQLAVPLELDSTQTTPRSDKPEGLAAPRTIGELIRHPHPQEDWLLSLKTYAQQHRHHPSSPLPLQVAYMLYYASLVLARVRCHTSISSLSIDDLIAGAHWALAQDWIDPASRQLFERVISPGSALK